MLRNRGRRWEMKIEQVHIKNFRLIKEAHISLKDLTMLIGNNGTGKTSILEAIHFTLSPSYLSGKIEPTDFYNGTNDEIQIEVVFNKTFTIEIPDGYVKQEVICKKIHLDIKKRERATPNKSFSDGYVITHYFVPEYAKTTSDGWEQARKGGKTFQFSKRHLAINYSDTDNILKSFYFNKNRSIQIKRGYNSSITSIFDDFNWRFINNLTDNEEDYITNKKTLENQIISNIDDKSLNKSITSLNEKLKEFGIPDVSISFIESHSPFNNAFLSNLVNTMDIKVDKLGSGIEMIISLMLLETLASLSKDEIMIIIDEPELHLHPSLQEHFIKYLKRLSSEKQILLSTHSPYFFKNCCSDSNIKLLVTETIDKKCTVKDSDVQLHTFPWSPSWGEINYFAYNLPTIEFHNELYGFCQKLTKTSTVRDFEIYLENKNYKKSKIWIREKDGVITKSFHSIMSYIRNLIHHPENQLNAPFTPEELKASIEKMLRFIGNFNTPLH
jgi:predicted ATP-dependent endonuclease of OLD family